MFDSCCCCTSKTINKTRPQSQLYCNHNCYYCQITSDASYKDCKTCPLVPTFHEPIDKHIYSSNHEPLQLTPYQKNSYLSYPNCTNSPLISGDNRLPNQRTTPTLLKVSTPSAAFIMDITYVTERIIVLTFPETGSNETYCANLQEVVQMLRTKHKTKYMIFNLSEKRHDLNKLNPNICEFGWPPKLAPPLERLCSICKAIDSWLTCDNNHFAVIHSKGDRGRTGVVIAAFMHYTNICATADQALDRFAMKRFYDDKLSLYMQPSQKRYVHYFAGLLSGAIKMNNNPLFLHHIIVHGVPNFDSSGGCRAFVKIYQGMKQIHTTGVYLASDNRARRVVIFLAPSVQLRGDILIKCYHKRQSPPGRTVIFRIQFHTCTLELDRLVFNKEELDDANADSRFPNDGFVEFLFNTYATKDRTHHNHNGLASDSNKSVIEDALNDPIVKWDSYENFDLNSQLKPDSSLDAFVSDINNPNNPNHTHGPVDGSLYATVAKTGSKKSPVTFSLPNGAVDNTSEEAPHTISIDSGISSTVSANPHHNLHTNMHSHTNGTSSGFPSPINVEVEVHNNHNHDQTAVNRNNKPTSEEQAALDELLSGMLQQIESFPDHPSTLRKSSSSSKNVFSSPSDSKSDAKKTPNMSGSAKKSDYSSIRTALSNGGSTASSDIVPTTPRFLTRPVQYNTTDDRKSYHVQSGSQPFSYGVTSSSPAIQRRKFLSESKDYMTETLAQNRDSNDIDDVFSDYTSSSYQDVFSEDGTPLTWLQRQQLKLKTKKEGKGIEERHWKERQLMAELRRVTKRIPHSDDSSSRETSPPYSQPLHINTMPSVNGHNGHSARNRSYETQTNSQFSAMSSPIIPARKSSKDISFDDFPDEWKTPTPSRPLQRQRSDNSHNRERPFVAVKRAHEEAKEEMFKLGKTSQEIAASSSLYGTVYPYSQHHVYMPNARVEPQSASLTRTGLLMQSQNSFDEVDSSPQLRSRPQHSTPSYKKSTIDELPTSWSPSFVGSSSPPNSLSRDSDRPPTPGFPYTPTPGTPYVYHNEPKSPPLQRKGAQSPSTPTVQFGDRTSPGGSVYYGQSQRSSLLSLNDSEVITQHPFFVKDTSSYWYKPNISREEAINMLRDKPSGTFVVRDSNSFPGAYGLALKVSTPPTNVQSKTGDISNELVRHFLIEPTNKGVRLKGCPNEPTFGSLSALVYQHSVTAMALPCKLIIPDSELSGEILSIDKTMVNSMSDTSGSILAQGAACNVLYLVTADMESLTGPQAVREAVNKLFSNSIAVPTVVHFKVSSKGITLTDNNHRLFFRRHYPINCVSYCGVDPDCRKWNNQSETITSTSNTCLCFGFVARKTGSKTDNQCHIFAEYEREQPASAIVNFVNRVMASSQSQQRSSLL